MSDDEIISRIIDHEGRAFSDRAADRGGPTRFGITLRTLAAWRHRPVTAADVAALEEPEARQILAVVYLERAGFGQIEPAQLRAFVVDGAVNHGVDGATKLLQHVLGVVVDGAFGPRSLAALQSQDPRRVYVDFAAARARLYGSLISHDALQSKNAGGWMNRLGDYLEEAPL